MDLTQTTKGVTPTQVWFGSVTAADKGEGPWGVSPVGARNATVRNGVWQGGPSEVDGPDAALVILEEVLDTNLASTSMVLSPSAVQEGPAGTLSGKSMPFAFSTTFHLPISGLQSGSWCMHAHPLPLSTPPPAHRPVLVSQLEQL